MNRATPETTSRHAAWTTVGRACGGPAFARGRVHLVERGSGADPPRPCPADLVAGRRTAIYGRTPRPRAGRLRPDPRDDPSTAELSRARHRESRLRCRCRARACPPYGRGHTWTAPRDTGGGAASLRCVLARLSPGCCPSPSSRSGSTGAATLMSVGCAWTSSRSRAARRAAGRVTEDVTVPSCNGALARPPANRQRLSALGRGGCTSTNWAPRSSPASAAVRGPGYAGGGRPTARGEATVRPRSRSWSARAAGSARERGGRSRRRAGRCSWPGS